MKAMNIGDPMQFFKSLQAITRKIYATSKIEEIMLDLSHDICDLFGCERLTLYAVSLSKTHIESKVKTGLRSFKDFSLPISENSVAGFVALTKKSVNIADVYDDAELKSHSPGLRFMPQVDQRTGYRTREMLVGALVNEEGSELLGVVQLINNRAGGAFSHMMEDGLRDLCETLSLVFAQRLSERLVARTKYDPLVMAGLLPAQELELAHLSARRWQVDVQAVLMDEFQIKQVDIGDALGRFFGVPYAPFQAGRVASERAQAHAKWAYAEHKRWLLLDEDADGVTILTTDPDRVKGARLVSQLFPQANVGFQVTTNHEFKQTADQFFGPVDAVAVRPQVSVSGALTEAEQALLQRVSKTINEAFSQHAADIQIEVHQEKGRMKRRLGEDGKVVEMRGRVTVNYRIACG